MTTPQPITFGGDLRDWFVQQAQNHQLAWLLVHSDDGVNWGTVKNGRLVISHDHFPEIAPPLRAITLQQARLFGTTGELLIWRKDEGHVSRFQAATDEADTLQAHYLLWGDRQEGSAKDGFVLLADGAEGLRHAPPLPVGVSFDATTQRMALQLQHHIAYDEDGQAYIVGSRLTGLTFVSPTEEK